MIGRTMLDKEEPVYHKYAEQSAVVSKAGISIHINEQGEIIEELIRAVNELENHLGPLTVSHPVRNGKEVDSSGDSQLVNAVRVHNHMLSMVIDRINDLRNHSQI